LVLHACKLALALFCARVIARVAQHDCAPYLWGMKYLLILPALALAACDMPQATEDLPPDPPAATLSPAAVITPPRNARTADQFDTTSAAERQAATQVSASAGAELGRTTATLGSPTEPGIWLRTGLVSEVTQGHIRYQNRTINVELRPSGRAAGSGSQISLAAMRLIEAPLTGIIELTVLR
jgi:hypothetical protein